MRIIWVRHGETEANHQGKYVGHLDPAINENGQEQVRQLCQELAKHKLTTIYTSDLKRCVQTAEHIAKTCGGGVPIRVPAIRELSFGKWEGWTYSEIMEREAEHATKWYDNPFEVSPPQGETVYQLGERVDEWIKNTIQTPSKPANERDKAVGDNQPAIAIVTHGGVLRWIMSKWLLGDPKQFWYVEGIAHGKTLVTVWESGGWSRQNLCFEAGREA